MSPVQREGVSEWMSIGVGANAKNTLAQTCRHRWEPVPMANLTCSFGQVFAGIDQQKKHSIFVHIYSIS